MVARLAYISGKQFVPKIQIFHQIPPKKSDLLAQKAANLLAKGQVNVMHFLGSTTGCIQAITACTKVQGTFNPTQDQKNLLLRKKQNETHIVFTY